MAVRAVLQRAAGVARSWWPVVALLLLVVVLATPLLAPAGGSPVHNDPSATGVLADLAREEGYEVRTAAFTPTEVREWDPARTLLVVVEPSTPYTAAEAARLQGWLEDGGRLIVADGTRHTAPVFEALGVESLPRRILDASLDGEGPTAVEARYVATGEPRRLRLEAPTGLDRWAGPMDWRPAVTTGDQSFLDLDGDGELDEGDARGPFVVGLEGFDGRALLLTSGAPFQDRHLGGSGGGGTVQLLLTTMLPHGGTLVIDTSHAARTGPSEGLFSLLQAPLSLGRALGWALVGIALAAAAAGLVAWRRSEGAAGWSEGDLAPEDVQGTDAPLDPDGLLADLERLEERSRRHGQDRLAEQRGALRARLQRLAGADRRGSP